MSHPRDNRLKHHRQTRREYARLTEEGFTCIQCGLYVPCIPTIAGVQNRNHCPCCLYSRHLDGLTAGDRRSGCRGAMQPVGLTTKRSRNKYASERDGELMIIHCCVRCRKVAINRIAADDGIGEILALFEKSWSLSLALQVALEAQGITLLTQYDNELVRQRLLGKQTGALSTQLVG